MSDSSITGSLVSYLPRLILGRLRGGKELDVPAIEHRSAVVLFADVNGFTSIAERFTAEGPAGAERLSRLLNDYFGRAIRQIDTFGGDVIRFAGDAILAAWTVSESKDLSAAALCAAQCGLALQSELREYPGPQGAQLTLKIGLGVGDFCVMFLGGEFARREFLATGPAFEQAIAAADRGAPGEVIVLPDCWNAFAGLCDGEETPAGFILRSSDQAPSTTSTSEPPIQESPLLPTEASAVYRQIRTFVSGTVTSQLEADQHEWIAALRVVSVLFVNLPDLNYATPLDRAQEIFLALQQELYRYEGTINKLNVDDKGTSLLAAMGLPPLAHEDDARRAVVAALAIHQRLGAEGCRVSVGVSTGRVFCGSVGNDQRQEYTILGDVVNLSARLMQAAGGEICCDDATYEAAQYQIEFERLPDIAVKGKSQPVAAYRPVRRKDSSWTATRRLVGRAAELELLNTSLRELLHAHDRADGHHMQTIVLEGEPGIGKSVLVAELLALAGDARITCRVGSGDSIETTTLYHAWKSILSDTLGLEPDPRAREQRKSLILDRLNENPGLVELAPLLNPILSVDFEDNEITRYMAGRVRGENTRSLVRRLISQDVAERPTVIVIEDIHWLDSASWSLVEDVSREVAPLLLVLTGRPVIQTADHFQPVLRARHTRLLPLHRLTREDTGNLLANSMNVDTASTSLVEMVYEKAGGNPLFTEQLGVAVQEFVRMHLRDGGNLESGLHAAVIDFPDTLHGAITGTIDRLEAPAQLAIKVASVIGRRFSYQALHDNYPVARFRPRVRDFMGAGLQAKLVEVAVPDPPVRYLFRHAIMQQVAYNLLLFKQRRELHRSIAQWYETNQDFQLENRPAILAHHWESAGVAAKAQKYALQAADTSYRNGAYAEAALHFQTALRLDKNTGYPAEAVQRSAWERKLGQSLLGMGNLAESKVHFQFALADLDRPAPESKYVLTASLAMQVAIQILRRLTPRVLRSLRLRWASRSRRRSEFLEAARTYERLGEVFYLANQRERLVHAVLSSLNLAERAGPSAQLARAYANSCFAAGLGRLHRLARSYARDARLASDEVQHPSAAAWVAEVTGIYLLGIGKLDDARRAFAQAIAINERLGDWPHWGENMAANAQAAYYHGDVELGERTWQELYNRAKDRHDDLQLAWGLNGRAEAILRMGRREEVEVAVGMLEEAVRLLTNNTDRVSRIGSFGLLSTAHLRCGRADDAARAADAGLQLSDQIANPTGYYSLVGYAHVAQTYLALWASGIEGQSDSLANFSLRACRALRRYAATFPLGRPDALLYWGQYMWLCGKRRRAQSAWRKCKKLAERLHMHYPQALAAWRLAASLPVDHAERAPLLVLAKEKLQELNARYELDQLRAIQMGDEGLEKMRTS